MRFLKMHKKSAKNAKFVFRVLIFYLLIFLIKIPYNRIFHYIFIYSHFFTLYIRFIKSCIFLSKSCNIIFSSSFIVFKLIRYFNSFIICCLNISLRVKVILSFFALFRFQMILSRLHKKTTSVFLDSFKNFILNFTFIVINFRNI